eukprot:6005238-Pyramimonas_sp.AAC.1
MVDAILGAPMIATMAAMTTARPMAAPMLITPADKDDDVLASAMEASESIRNARAADAREWPA